MPRKKRPEGSRAPNGASSIYYSEYDKKWHGRVSMGVRDDGKPDRPHVKRETEGEVIVAVRELEKQRDSGLVRKPGRPWTVERWLTHWIENIAPLTLRYKALETYRTGVYVHLIPGLGAHRIDRIEPEHFEKLYAKMKKAGLSPSSVHKVHRTARTAFNEALRRSRVTRNVVSLAKAPTVKVTKVEPFEATEIQRIITAALKRRNGVRFVVALALGVRQGEALAFRWDNLNRRTKTYPVDRALQRQPWQHGCDDPRACATPHCRTECADPCKRHRNARNCVRNEKGHPRPCIPDCTRHAMLCPERHGGGLLEVEVKSEAGNRSFTLPDELFTLLLQHEQVQQREREHASTEWHDGGWMFTQPTGKPIDARRDWGEWKVILQEAGVRDARLHDARHTAATVLLLLGVHERVVMDVMGWSSPDMRKRYMHVTEGLRQDVADQLNRYFWKAK